MRPALALLLATSFLVAACATPRPVLYPNPHYQQVGEEQANSDVADCQAKAKQYVKDHKAELVARHSTLGAATGAVLGVVASAFTGNIARGAAEGAAIGGAGGAIRGGAQAASPDQVQRRFTDTCLVEKGYQPIGWR